MDECGPPDLPELWRTVKEYAAYEVSSLGRVRRALPGRGATVGRILKTPVDSEGYPHVNLGTKRNERVHVLVASAFLGPIPKHGQVHHRNTIRTDCRVENLEVTRSQLQHSERHRRVRLDLRRFGEPNPLICCRCGCGEKLRKYGAGRRPRRYVNGHNFRGQTRTQGRFATA